jgi:transposase-like protein
MSNFETTPTALAKEIGISPKTLRQWLRTEHPRSFSEKGTRWRITLPIALAAKSHWG